MENMDSLNVKQPDFLTRDSSEYTPEVIDYIKQIIQNEFAYESAGSVYFDTGAFTDAGQNYGKLEPGSVGNQSLIAEGEFVLWKKSKNGELTWESPWRPGRPGWHIEFSAMVSNVLGPLIDIHAGGVDLHFRHHSDEVAQAEAYQSSHNYDADDDVVVLSPDNAVIDLVNHPIVNGGPHRCRRDGG
ncbi:unnamed protein product [Chondrus crispus]|uniref:tRNA synthetases class I catalytic domain-containing protein n=1 Tax=Chondrus crispus TaxID=2769 RepID=R7QRP8_CHOCR|nr:unnamed protein product [Chondrus crispus]CDF40176.1 unnamed protein product [Chondrus crispus]|eukprot:XP_005710470.1 unnamed protein product [Chondrus crispus]